MKRLVGIHLRCNQSLTALIEKIARIDLPIFQCFLRQQSGPIVPVCKEEIQLFHTTCAQLTELFVHASYRINLAEETFTHHPALKQELYWAQKLGFTHIILHPGAAQSHDKGIDAVVRILNKTIQSSKNIQFVLENVAFTAPSLGGSLEDLQIIRQKLDTPERLSFCIDTAHAYAFGYDLASEQDRNCFITVLEQIVGINNIALIHINDTQSALGSRHDIHCRIGVGNLGSKALKAFATDKRLQHIPLILELPSLEEKEEQEDLATVNSWLCTTD